MPRNSEENPTRPTNDPNAMSIEFLHEVNERLIEWLKQEATVEEATTLQDATIFHHESLEEDTFSDEEQPEDKPHWPIGRMALRMKKWFTDRYHHEG
ncbi:hypothetical protein F52700_5884 [Fusarium sp. NRRL 52700]|nr:hypothetical protein F52700_5884 [Fusarium sp. NRRL 52700]